MNIILTLITETTHNTKKTKTTTTIRILIILIIIPIMILIIILLIMISCHCYNVNEIGVTARSAPRGSLFSLQLIPWHNIYFNRTSQI